MIFSKGRDNLSTTVYVPFDCTNNCKFCTSKQDYSKYKSNLSEIIKRLHEVRNSTIEEVVFTGGEPMSNVKVLKELVKIVNNKDVYINTSLIKNNQFADFLFFVDTTDCIKGINISRHYDTFEKDEKILNNIAEDSFIKLIRKPVKINVVLQNKLTRGFVSNVLYRWYSLGKENLKVCFRADFTKQTSGSIHDLTDPAIDILASCGDYINRGFCNVCDTTNFIFNDFMEYSYHRGVELTSIKIGDNIEVNDIIIRNNGEMIYDWDGKSDNIEIMKRQFRMEYEELEIVIHETPIKLSKKQEETSDFYIATCGARINASIGSCGSRPTRTIGSCGGRMELYNRSCGRSVSSGSCGGRSSGSC